MQPPPRKKRRLSVNTNTNTNNIPHNTNDNAHNTNNSNNSNNNNNNNSNNNNNAVTAPPQISVQPKVVQIPKYTHALAVLNDKLDQFEREQLDKKKLEMYEITKQKLLAMTESIETEFLCHPHLIGCIPGIDAIEQQKISFNCWINNYKHIIKSDDAIRTNGIEIFMTQILQLQTEPQLWNTFFTKWRLNRMLLGDNFQVIWRKVKMELNIYIDEEDIENEDDDMKQEEILQSLPPTQIVNDKQEM